MKLLACILGLAFAIAVATPVFAAVGSFPDVPPDHWAYDAVNRLQEKGIIHGYPNGYFDGKRTLTRYEFAVAIDRMIPWIMENLPTPSMSGYVKQSDLDALKTQLTNAMNNKADKSEITRLENMIKALEAKIQPPADLTELKKTVESIRRLVDEFKDDLANIGVEVEALKKDVTALREEVAGLKNQMKSVPTFMGTGSIGAIGTGTRSNSVAEAYGFPVNGQQMGLGWNAGSNTPQNNVLHNVADLSFYNFNLGMKARVGENIGVEAVLNIGNYLSWLAGTGTTDEFKVTPWIFKATMPVSVGPLGEGKLTLGKFPLQYTKFTMRWANPDYYVFPDVWTTGPDAGGYPVFGAELDTKLGSVDIKSHVATHTNVFYPQAPVDTSVGGRATLAIGPGEGKLGFTALYAGVTTATAELPGWMWAWVTPNTTDMNRVGILGADWNGNIADNLGFAVEYSKYYEIEKGVRRLTNTDNGALDARFNYKTGDLGIMAGYVDIESNFRGPMAYWGRFGRTVNIVDVKGPVAQLSYNFSENVSANVGAELFSKDNNLVVGSSTDPINTYPKGDVSRYYAGIEWGFKSNFNLKVEGEQIIWDPDGYSRNPTEQYLTFQIGHDWNENSFLRLLYQVVDWKGKNVNLPYGADYKGSIVGAQVGVRF